MTEHERGSFWERFRVLSEQIGASRRQREDSRSGNRDAVRSLAEVGFGRLRVPTEHGGEGFSLAETIEAVIALAEQDPGIAHAFRGHLVYIETTRLQGYPEYRKGVYAELARDKVLALAGSELSDTG